MKHFHRSKLGKYVETQNRPETNGKADSKKFPFLNESQSSTKSQIGSENEQSFNSPNFQKCSRNRNFTPFSNEFKPQLSPIIENQEFYYEIYRTKSESKIINKNPKKITTTPNLDFSNSPKSRGKSKQLFQNRHFKLDSLCVPFQEKKINNLSHFTSTRKIKMQNFSNGLNNSSGLFKTKKTRKTLNKNKINDLKQLNQIKNISFIEKKQKKS